MLQLVVDEAGITHPPSMAPKKKHFCLELGLRVQDPQPPAQKGKCAGVSELHLNPEAPVPGMRKSGQREPVRVLSPCPDLGLHLSPPAEKITALVALLDLRPHVAEGQGGRSPAPFSAFASVLFRQN